MYIFLFFFFLHDDDCHIPLNSSYSSTYYHCLLAEPIDSAYDGSPPIDVVAGFPVSTYCLSVCLFGPVARMGAVLGGLLVNASASFTC